MTWTGCNEDDLVKSDFMNKKDISNSSEYENALNTVKLFSEQNRQEKTKTGWYLQSNMEQPTDKTAPYLDNNTQLYITSIAPTRVENSTSNDNLPPF